MSTRGMSMDGLLQPIPTVPSSKIQREVEGWYGKKGEMRKKAPWPFGFNRRIEFQQELDDWYGKESKGELYHRRAETSHGSHSKFQPDGGIQDKTEDCFQERCKVLDINERHRSSLPPIDRKKLKVLEARHNRLSRSVGEIGRIKGLQRLVLSSNHLKEFPQPLLRLHQLEELVLSDNQCKRLPKEIAQLKKLKHLCLTNNQLKKLPEEICSLSNLEELMVDSNRLRTLPQRINELRELKELNLEYNQQLRNVSNGLFTLSAHCKLFLKGCDFSSVLLTRMETLVNKAGYCGPTVVIDEVKEQRSLSLEELVEELHEMGDRTLPNLKPLYDADVCCYIEKWLRAIVEILEFPRGGELRKLLLSQLLDHLERASRKESFRELLFAVIDQAMSSDRMSLALSLIDIRNGLRLMKIATDDLDGLRTLLLHIFWGWELIKEMARDKSATLPFYDEIEIYFGYLLGLNKVVGVGKEFDLPLYGYDCGLTERDLQACAEVILQRRADHRAGAAFLIQWQPWHAMLKRYDPEKWREIEQLHEAMQIEGNDSVKADAIYEQGLINLTMQLTISSPSMPI